jgi:hypothetical protein
MTAAVKPGALKPAPDPDRGIAPLAVFIARCEARALLWQAGELDLHEAVDELQAAAVRDGLVAQLGQDEVQRLMVEAFAPLRDDLPWSHAVTTELEPDDDVVPDLISEDENQGDIVTLKSADDEYDGLPSTFANACRKADEKARQQRALERPTPYRVPSATLRAAEYLLRLGDPPLWRKWFDAHSAQERARILQYLEQRKRRRGK